MKARTIRETEYTWEQIEEILAAGKARETFGEDGQITVQVEGIGTALLNILDYDKDKAADPDMRTMTLQFADLPFDEMPFDENGCNKWEESSIRRNMNSIGFKERFEEGFRKTPGSCAEGEWRQRGNTGHVLPSVRGRNEGQRKEVSAVQIRTRLRESQSGAGDRVALDKICVQKRRYQYVVCGRVWLRRLQRHSEQLSLRPGLRHRSESNQIISARHAGHRRSKGAGR